MHVSRETICDGPVLDKTFSRIAKCVRLRKETKRSKFSFASDLKSEDACLS